MYQQARRESSTTPDDWYGAAPGKRTLTAGLVGTSGPRVGPAAAESRPAAGRDEAVSAARADRSASEAVDADAVGDAPQGFDLDAFLDFGARPGGDPLGQVGDDPLATAEPGGVEAASTAGSDAQASGPPAGVTAGAADPAPAPALQFIVGGHPSSRDAGKKPKYGGSAVTADLSPVTVWSSVVLTPEIVRAAKIIVAAGFMTPGSKPPAAPGGPAAPGPDAPPAGPDHMVPPALLEHVGRTFEHDGGYVWEVTPEGYFKVVGAPGSAKTGGIARPTGKMAGVWLTLCDHLLAIEDGVCEQPTSAVDDDGAASTETPIEGGNGVLDQVLAALGAGADALYAELFGAAPGPANDAAATAGSNEPPTSEQPAASTSGPYLPAGTVITSGWRVDERQAQIIIEYGGGSLIDGDLYKTYLAAKKSKDVAWVGESDHRCGLAIDFSGDASQKANLAEGLARCRAEHPEAGMGAPFPEKQNCVHVPVTG